MLPPPPPQTVKLSDTDCSWKERKKEIIQNPSYHRQYRCLMGPKITVQFLIQKIFHSNCIVSEYRNLKNLNHSPISLALFAKVDTETNL